jgi:uncharacterized protein
LDIAEQLITAGADPDLQDKDGTSALIFAASIGRSETTKLLIALGANPNLKDK